MDLGPFRRSFCPDTHIPLSLIVEYKNKTLPCRFHSIVEGWRVVVVVVVVVVVAVLSHDGGGSSCAGGRWCI